VIVEINDSFHYNIVIDTVDMLTQNYYVVFVDNYI